MNFCKKFWSRQFSAGTSTKTRKSSKRKSRKPAPRNYKFPTLRSSTSTRRYRKVA